MDTPIRGRLVSLGERVSHTVRYTQEEIARFATLTHDSNPLHRDAAVARRVGFNEVIACGQQTTSMMMGLLASHFSRDDDGVAREMLALNVNFAFKQPVFAGQDLELVWTVSAAEWNSKLGGMLAHLDGGATRVGNETPSVVARATILVKHID